MLIVLGSNDNFQQEEEKFLFNYSKPVTLIDLQDVYQLPNKSNTASHRVENYLHNLIIFNSSPCLKVDNLQQLYIALKSRYQLEKTVIVTAECIKEDEAYDRLLFNISQENIFLLLPETSQVRHWVVADSKVHRYHFSNWRIPVKKYSKFTNRHLRVATINYPPVCIISNEGNVDGPDTVHGIEPHLMVMIAEYLNFTFDYSQSRPTELWDGMTQLIKEKKVDIAIGDLYMLAGQPYDYSIPYKFNYEGFIVPIPQPYAKWTALVYPFSVLVWIATFLSIISAILVLRCLAKCTFRPSMSEEFFHDTMRCFCYVIGSFLGVAQPRQINSMTYRVFVTFWLLSAATIIPAVYRSGFISLMTSPPAQRPIDTVRELSVSSLGKATLDTEFFKSSGVSFEQSLGHQMVNANVSQMMHLIGTGSWAIEGGLDFLQYAIASHYSLSSRSNSKFHVMKEFLIPTRSCMVLQKDSPLKVYIDQALQRLREYGFVKYHQSKFVKKLQEFRIPVQPSAFSLDHLQGAFYLLLFGVLLSFFVFILEHFVFYVINRKKKRNN